MKKLGITLIIIIGILGQGAVYASSDTEQQTITITSPRTLQINQPVDISYVVASPLVPGDEIISPAELVRLKGNYFENQPGEPYITAALTGTITNAEIIAQGITITTKGTVTADPNGGDLTLNAAAQDYAWPDVAQRGTSGEVIGQHVLILRKLDIIPEGAYIMVINWMGYDTAAGP